MSIRRLACPNGGSRSPCIGPLPIPARKRANKKEARARCLFVGAPPIDVVISDDIVLIEIGPRLDLDEEGRDLTRVGEAMLLADRDIGGLVLAQHLDLVAPRDLECAADHDPMLRT